MTMPHTSDEPDRRRSSLLLEQPPTQTHRRHSTQALMLGSHNLAFTQQDPSHLFPPDPNHQTDSVIDDAGDTKQLEQTRDPEPPKRIPTGPVVTQAGTFPLSEEPQQANDVEDIELEPAGTDSHVQKRNSMLLDTDASKRTSILLADIRSAEQDSTWPSEDAQFLPINKIVEYMTRARICEELGVLRGVDDPVDLSRQIWGISSLKDQKLKTTRRKLFTILFQMSKTDTIHDLIKEGIHDSDLPFEIGNKALHELVRKPPVPVTGNDSPPWAYHQIERTSVPVTSFMSWKPFEREHFFNWQWKVLSPYFTLSSNESRKVHHYPLHPRTILPFLEASSADDESFEHEGGFSEVRKVKIHPAHQNLCAPNTPLDDVGFVAIKRLRHGNGKKLAEFHAEFIREVNGLKRVRVENHINVIRLLATFERNKVYYLVFPWADANLHFFWREKFPNVDDMPRDATFIRWMAGQFKGLAEGLKLIHHSLMPEDNDLSMPPDSGPRFGRHGDIKPENILWFRGDGEFYPGVLKIADFGFTDFHRKESVKTPGSLVGRSPTYRPPECDFVVTPASDMWSLGCVLLEFVVWYCDGWSGVAAFSKARAQAEVEMPKEDKFFNVSRERKMLEMRTSSFPLEAKRDRERYRGSFSLKRADSMSVKSCVNIEMLRLKAKDLCSGFCHDVLDFIDQKLLQIQHDRRADCNHLVQKFTDLHKTCVGDEVYCVYPSRGSMVFSDFDISEEPEGPVRPSLSATSTGETTTSTVFSSRPEPPSNETSFDSVTVVPPVGTIKTDESRVVYTAEHPAPVLAAEMLQADMAPTVTRTPDFELAKSNETAIINRKDRRGAGTPQLIGDPPALCHGSSDNRVRDMEEGVRDSNRRSLWGFIKEFIGGNNIAFLLVCTTLMVMYFALAETKAHLIGDLASRAKHIALRR